MGLGEVEDQFDDAGEILAKVKDGGRDGVGKDGAVWGEHGKARGDDWRASKRREGPGMERRREEVRR